MLLNGTYTLGYANEDEGRVSNMMAGWPNAQHNTYSWPERHSKGDITDPNNLFLSRSLQNPTTPDNDQTVIGKEANIEAGKDTGFEELDSAMERLKLRKVKFQYHTAKDLPTKEEAMENFKRGIIDRKYQEKFQQSK